MNFTPSRSSSMQTSRSFSWSSAETLLRIRGEIRGCAERRIRRVGIHELVPPRAGEDSGEGLCEDPRVFERGRAAAQILLVDELRIFVVAERHVELPSRVHAIEAVEAGFVEVEKPARPPDGRPGAEFLAPIRIADRIK